MSYPKRLISPRGISVPSSARSLKNTQPEAYSTYSGFYSPNRSGSSKRSTSQEQRELENLTKEALYLRNSIRNVNKDIKKIKERHQDELKTIHFAFEELRRDIETIKFEKVEENAKAPSGSIEDYTKLAQELISLRTDVDRLSSTILKEERASIVHNLEKLLHDKTRGKNQSRDNPTKLRR